MYSVILVHDMAQGKKILITCIWYDLDVYL